jgi:hypothetical protein
MLALKVDFQGSQVASDGGLILVPELDERLGLAAQVKVYHIVRIPARIPSFPK